MYNTEHTKKNSELESVGFNAKISLKHSALPPRSSNGTQFLLEEISLIS